MSTRFGALALCAVVAAACGDSTSPEGDSPLTLSVTAPTAAALKAPAGLSFAITQTDGTNELVLTRVALVLREIELKRVLATDCDSASGGDDDDCEEFETGPFILEVPVDGTVKHVVGIDVPADEYDQIEFDVHKPDDDSPEDQAFLAANPDFLDTSVVVEGTWNGEPFRFTQDLNEEQEIDLSPPLVVLDDGSFNLTMELDVTSWFLASDGSLIDPSTANKGEPNEGLVEFNIRRSIEIFEDGDKDGEKD